MNDPLLEFLQFGADDLVPAVVQDAVTGDVLMLAFMNDEALRLTVATGKAHYWSRSRQKLWRKGETSGHTQSVAEIRVNCERNSVLLLVRQTGAVCHDGYPTCYYRRLSDDGTLTIVREQAFDPATVYGEASSQSTSNSEPNTENISSQAPARNLGSPAAPFREGRGSCFVGMARGVRTALLPEFDRLAELTRRQFGAYAHLRDNDFTAESATSRRLRSRDSGLGDRVGDELRELAGVLDGAHQHTDFLSDLRLESSQVIYWVLVQALRQRVTWSHLRPDRALTTDDTHPDQRAIARLLRAEADRWSSAETHEDLAAKAHATLALVALACRSGGLDPLAAVESDLEDLQARPYLAAYFGHEDDSHERVPERKQTAAT